LTAFAGLFLVRGSAAIGYYRLHTTCSEGDGYAAVSIYFFLGRAP